MSALLTPGEVAATATTTATRDESGRSPDGERPAQRGGAEGTRTPDPHTASVVRYQLRHSPEPTRSGVSEPLTTIQSPAAGPGEGSPPRAPRVGSAQSSAPNALSSATPGACGLGELACDDSTSRSRLSPVGPLTRA